MCFYLLLASRLYVFSHHTSEVAERLTTPIRFMSTASHSSKRRPSDRWASVLCFTCLFYPFTTSAVISCAPTHILALKSNMQYAYAACTLEACAMYEYCISETSKHFQLDVCLTLASVLVADTLKKCFISSDAAARFGTCIPSLCGQGYRSRPFPTLVSNQHGGMNEANHHQICDVDANGHAQ